MELHAVIHEEDGSYWAEVKELPGCFASGRNLDEMKDALVEAIDLYLTNTGSGSLKEDIGAEGTPTLRVDELKLVTA